MVSLVQNKELTPNIVEKLFREACQALSEPSLSRDTSSFKVEYVGNSKDAEKILQRTLREFTYYVINNRYFGCQIMGFRILEGIMKKRLATQTRLAYLLENRSISLF